MQVTYHHQWKLFELAPFAFVGAIGGLIGAFIHKMNLKVARGVWCGVCGVFLRSWVPFAFVGAIGGLIGAFMHKMNLKVARIRKTSQLKKFPISGAQNSPISAVKEPCFTRKRALNQPQERALLLPSRALTREKCPQSAPEAH